MRVESLQFFVGTESHPMYVECFTNTTGAGAEGERNLVLVHGGAHTGTCWVSTPDERPGWASYFAAQGWSVYVVDWPSTGRSGMRRDFLTMGTAPVLEGLASLASRIGRASYIGHGLGAPIVFRFASEHPEVVSAIVTPNAAPFGNVPFDSPLVPKNAHFILTSDFIEHGFAAAERFPKETMAAYRKSLCSISPSIFNQVGSQRLESKSEAGLELRSYDDLRKMPILFVSADEDPVCSNDMTRECAELLGAEHILLGLDWGLSGFGHMSVVEHGTLEIAAKVHQWLTQHHQPTSVAG